VFLANVSMHKQVIHVDQDILDVPEDPLHESLEACWTAEQAHRWCDPLQLAFLAKAVRFCDFPSSLFCQNPDVKILRWKNAWVGISDVTNTSGDFIHWVFVDVGILVQLSEVLYNQESLARFLGMQKMGEL
jgi:hypothetical protein